MTTRDACSKVGRTVLALGLTLGLGCGGGGSDADGGTQHGGGKDSSAAQPGDGSTPAASTDASTPATASDAAPPMGMGGMAPVPKNCVAPAPNQPPEVLSCTGLYSDIAAKKLGSDVHEFAPAVPLWSDGADKTRWVYLPAGEKIDISAPDSWRFPIGTKFWKEFRSGTKRMETRVYWKLSATFWARTAYKWNDAETEATRSGGEEVKVAGGTYHIPSTTECDQCHKGRLDRALGFEAISLGMTGATGLTLAELDKQGLLTGGPVPSNLKIGDDGTGLSADALAWLHVNCGVSCHNGNSAAEGYSSTLRLDLKVADANGKPPTGTDAFKTAINVTATTGAWLGRVRIVPGAPDKSLLYSLMSTRTPATMKNQMPPIASRVVPKDAAQLIKDWIAAM